MVYMPNRLVSLLLVPFVLLAQGSGFAHSHGGTGVAEPPGHDFRPHVHLGLGGAHHHDHGGHHHHPGDDDDSCDDNPLRPAPAGDHDDDAVYLPNLVSVSIRPQSLESPAKVFSPALTFGSTGAAPAAAHRPWLAHPPPPI